MITLKVNQKLLYTARNQVKNLQQILRPLSTQISQDKKSWTTIYKFPLIRWAAALCRLKNYQIGFTALGLPTAFALQSAKHIPDGAALVFSSLGISGCLTLTLVSYATKNLIGFIYVSRDEQQVRLAYIDFWGRRKHLDLHIDDIVPPSETASTKWDLYTPVKSRQKDSEIYKLSHRFGEVRDSDKFTSIFGE